MPAIPIEKAQVIPSTNLLTYSVARSGTYMSPLAKTAATVKI